MTRNSIKDKNEIARLDTINQERKDSSLDEIVDILYDLNQTYILCNINSTFSTKAKYIAKRLANEIKNLENIEEKMRWHCEYFNYNLDICDQINDACYEFGVIISNIMHKENDYNDIESFRLDLKQGLIILSKVLATLITWDDELNNTNN